MLELIMVVVFFLVFSLILILSSKRICPPNTVIIIDRNTHYYKTIRAGSYSKRYSLKNSDMVTTIISTKETTVQYSNVFMTHDSRYYMISYHASYKCDDLDAVVNALQDSRRSIYDIINHAVSIAFKSFSSSDFSRYSVQQIKPNIYSQVENMLEPFYIDFINIVIDSITYVNEHQGEAMLFRKHESQGEMPIKWYEKSVWYFKYHTDFLIF